MPDAASAKEFLIERSHIARIIGSLASAVGEGQKLSFFLFISTTDLGAAAIANGLSVAITGAFCFKHLFGLGELFKKLSAQDSCCGVITDIEQLHMTKIAAGTFALISDPPMLRQTNPNQTACAVSA